MIFVYVLQSINRNYIYVGLTNDFNRRLEEHQSLKNKTTRAYSPFSVILIETFKTRPEARKREKYLKSGVGKEFIKLLLINQKS